MSDSENGTDGQGHNGRPVTTPARSTSPPKRSAVEMEDVSHHTQQTFADQTHSFDPMDTQEPTLPNSVAASSIEGLPSANTSTTSFERSPTVSAKGDDDMNGVPEIIPSLEEQVRQIQLLAQQPLGEGDRGVVVSSQWLVRVLSRTADGLTNSEYPKSAREGSIGPVDNANIVPPGGFSPPVLTDKNKAAYIPLRSGLQMGQDFEVLPYDAYGKIVGWHGAVQGQKMILRYAHETAPPDATSSNIQYELFPPVVTIRKLPISKSNTQDNDKSRSAVLSLKMRQSRQSYGQMSTDDAIRLVSSRFERYQKFLARAKEHAGVVLTTKVKVWRTIDQPQDDSARSTPNVKLCIDQNEFDELESASKLELVAVQDQTANDKYNGSSDMDTMSLFGTPTLVLVELSGNEVVPQRKTVTAVKSSTKAASTDSARNSSTTGVMTRGRVARSGRTRGTVGLQNLGNTCYMNSALQCIRSVEELSVYFLMNQYKKEINGSNPIGYKGAMATRYAEVVRAIYNESAAGSYSPSGFKATLSKHASTFNGFGQQDSQEFLSFLVDALHEDLNRIEKKPFLENPDSDDNRVNDPAYIVELGNTYRNNHRARNDSIAMDLFSGFYKNTMECPNCDKVSVTFDPYSALTLQLPISNTFTHAFIYVPLRGQPVKHDVDVEKSTLIRDLKLYIASKHKDTDPAKLWMVEVYNHKIYKAFDDGATLAEANIQSNDHIFIFELESVPTYPPSAKSGYGRRIEPVPDMDSPQADILTVPVMHRRLKAVGGKDATLVLHPQYISLTREEAKDFSIIQKKVLIAISQLTSRSFLTEEDDMQPVQHEETAEVSDHSEPSEEDYVNVSIDKADTAMDQGTDSDTPGRIPDGFMNPEYILSDRLSKMLFTLNYAKSSDGGHCASLGSYEDRSIRAVSTRVKAPSRRPSIDSTTSETTESTAGDDTVATAEEVTTAETAETPSSMQSEAAEEETEANSTSKRTNTGKGNKFKGGNKADKEEALRKRQEKNQRKVKQVKALTPVSPAKQDDSNQYYIQIGEALLVDWHMEAWVELFEGGDKAPTTRGKFLSSETGAGLPIVEDATAAQKRAARERRRKHGISLEECFAETGKREKLSEDNAWYCNRCKELRQATKTLEIWTLPDILVLHLKRFGGNRRFNDKIDVMVDYPIEGLDLNDKVGLTEDGKDYTYDLFAIDNHYGGLGGGHYTAEAKSFIDGAWYDYNDSSCTKHGEAPRKSAAAYLLFYRRRSDKPLGPPYLQDLVYKFRSPSEADESDSGEGSLDGPSSTLHGSSSNSLAAGVTAMTGNGPAVSAGGSGVEFNRKTNKSPTTSDDDAIDGRAVYGPSTDGRLLRLREETPGWGFGSLDNGGVQSDDNDSTKAEADGDTSFQDSDEAWNDPEVSISIGGDDSALHLEDAGSMGDDSVHEVRLSTEQQHQ